jgi:hypothetical protein
LLTRWTGLRQFGYLASTVILVVFFPVVLEHKDLLFPKVGLKIRLQPPVASVDTASQLLIVSVVCAKEPPRGEACEPALRFNSQPISREDSRRRFGGHCYGAPITCCTWKATGA